MERQLMGIPVRQSHKTEMISANDLLKVGNKSRTARDEPATTIRQYLNNEHTKELMREIEERYKTPAKAARRGRYTGTWFHPILAMDFALWVDPKLKVEVYQWLLDNLLMNRDKSGDSYKFMSGALFELFPRKRDFVHYIQKVALVIQKEVGVADWNKATEEELEHRNELQMTIGGVCDFVKDPNEAIRQAVLTVRKQREFQLKLVKK